MSGTLSAKEQAFVDAYDGNGTAACRAAGYKGSDAVLATQASRLLRKAKVRDALEKRRAPKRAALVASRQERQEFWSAVMNSPEYEPKDRLKASELLGRSQADFVERLEHSGANGQPLNVVIDLGASRKKDSP